MRRALLACLLLFGPERIPLDAVTQWEIRVRLCERGHVVVETRTYERVRAREGWRYYLHRAGQPPSEARRDPDEAWWTVEAEVHLEPDLDTPAPE